MSEFQQFAPSVALSYAAFLIAIATPGPNIIALISISMSGDRRSATSFAMGIALGSLIWATLTATGITAVLVRYESSIVIFKLCGGSYLLWLAYKMFKAAVSTNVISVSSDESRNRSRLSHIAHGIYIQVTNPKSALAWMAIMSVGIHANSPNWVAFSIITGTFLISIIIHLSYVNLFSNFIFISYYNKYRIYIQSIFGIIFLIIGLRLIFERS
jgi:amino acid exporter